MAGASLEHTPGIMGKKLSWYVRLESESSLASEEDTESISSLQGKDTDLAKDTTDTDTKSEYSSDESSPILEVEYEVASLSGDDHPLEDGTSSGTDDVLATAGAIAAAICDDTSLEAWITDVEDSDNSSLGDSSFGRATDYWTCIQCKSRNNNPLFRYCEKCFQERKTYFPPRPRRHKRSKKVAEEPPVKLNTLRSCLNGLASQDSGIGSSQEFGTSSKEIPHLDLEQIVVPKQLSSFSSVASTVTATTSDVDKNAIKTINNRKRQYSESSLSDFEEAKKLKTSHRNELDVLKSTRANIDDNISEKGSSKTDIEIRNDKGSEETKIEGDAEGKSSCKHDGSESTASLIRSSLPEYKELCILCNSSPKNSIFLHGKIAHMCSCYRCGVKTWLTNKRCPVCSRKVKNVVKVFTV